MDLKQYVKNAEGVFVPDAYRYKFFRLTQTDTLHIPVHGTPRTSPAA